MKRALVTGVTGQDGSYLSKLLLEKGYTVYGGFKRSSHMDDSRLQELGIAGEVRLVPLELLEITNILRTIEDIQPDEVYNLAAQSFVAVSFEQPLLTSDIDAQGVLRLLEALRTLKKDARFYQASTSEMFGKAQAVPQNEATPFYPRSPYGVAKLFAHWATVNYREAHGMFCCSGILFNHESPLRGMEFVTRKISHAVARIRYGLEDKLVLGNLGAKRDWGFAPEYVHAMWLMLQQEVADDYVIATGEAHTVREFVEVAFRVAGTEIAWEGEEVAERGVDARTGRVLVEVSPEHFRPAEVDYLLGDPSKARERLGWAPRTRFEDLVATMVEADLKRVSVRGGKRRATV